MRCRLMDSGLAEGRRPEDELRQISPTGKSILIYGNHVKPKNKKYFAFPEWQIRAYIFDHPVLLRRASAVVTDVGRVAVDAEVATDERSLSVR